MAYNAKNNIGASSGSLTISTHLVEPVLASVTDIDDLDDLGHQPRIKHIALTQLGLKVRASGKHEPGDVDLVVGDKMLHGQLRDLAHVVVSLLVSKTGETERGLAAATVLLGQVDGELVDDLAGVARQDSEKSTVSVHDDEAKARVRLEKLRQGFRVEFVVTQVQRPDPHA
jgi:hypothetical protein